MRSITARLVLGTGLVLTVFVILVAFSVSYSVHNRAETARIDSLRGLVYGLLGATDIEGGAYLNVNKQALPDSRLNRASSGLFAELIGSDGSILWQSDSVTEALPATVIRPIGDWLYESIDSAENDANQIHRLQLSTAWEFDNGEELPFIVHVVDQADSLGRQLKRFDQTLWISLLTSAIALLVIQLLVLRKSLQPLLAIGNEVAEIEKGDRDELSEAVPAELAGLTSGLNALLRAERQRHEQYRHLLGDLGHSLKTPMTVLQNLANASEDTTLANTIKEQTSLMQTSLQRYSQRASLRGPRYLSAVIRVSNVVDRIVQSLDKLYQATSIRFELAVEQTFTVRMDEADLLEVMGNILENASKYGATHIRISTGSDKRSLIIDDNGPGFPPGDLQRFKQRGVRADSETPGTGMGLAAAQQIISHYAGSLDLEHSPMGGARVILTFS